MELTRGRKGYEKTEFGQDAAISVEEEAIFVQSYRSCARDLHLETLWMQADLETIVCKFGRNPTIYLREEAIFVPAQNCPIK